MCPSDKSYRINVHKNLKLQFQIYKFTHFEYSTKFHEKVLVRKFINNKSEYLSLRKNTDVQQPTFANVPFAYNDKSLFSI